MDLVRRIDRRAPDQVLQRHTHGQELRHHLGHAEHGEVSRVQIGRNGIGNKTLLDSRHGIAKPETSGPMANVKNHAPGAGLGQDRIELAVRQQDGKLLGEDVSVNVAGPHLLQI